MKSYIATYGANTVEVLARHLYEAQALACQKLGLRGNQQHLVKVQKS